MAKKAKIERSSDEIREIILRFLYDVHKKAFSPKQIKLNITELKRGLKPYGLDGKEIMSNLDYLIQTGFILKEEETTQIKTGKGIFLSKKTYYKVSDKAISYFEGVSKFQKIDKSISGINITNVQGVTNIVSGDSNQIIVKNEYIDLYKALDILGQALQKEGKLSDEEKLNYIGDIDTIRSQLSTTNPDKAIITQAWDKLQKLATISGVVTLFGQISHLIVKLVT